ncbi:MAG: universal stress protein [Candidatus Tectomicrobia bacterium]|nr:universal stress protein [Candidatus Tectomicrobia bacterium]
MTYARILVPTDFSADADHALEHAIGLARQFQSRLTLVHVVHLYLPGSAEAGFPAYVEQLRRDADQQLQAPRSRVEATEVPFETCTEMGVPADRIVEVARDRQVDLIVMGTQGRTGLPHLLLGSVAEHVVRLAPCPVLVTRKGAAPQ